MVFASTVFMFLFLPAVWLIYSLIPQRYLHVKNAILAVASLVFYAYGEPVYIFLICVSVLVNYLAALALEAKKVSERGKRLITVLCVAADLGVLIFFKYIPWLVSMVNGAFAWSIPVPNVKMPIGISFYTFQILSYVIDVRRGKTAAQRNFIYLFLYISFFPQFIAGPIVKYIDIQEQIVSRDITVEKTARGIRRFIYGLSKKVLVSNAAALIADAAFGAAAPSAAFAWAGAVSYCIQIYFDFSGYSDMAIGLALMFGFDICENFNYPYAAVSIRDFWKRWHISLTSWFREYVYFPLGGNRVSGRRTVLNRYIVFFLTGLWHGANFTYILWGLWHGTLMMFEKVIHMEKWVKKWYWKPVCHVYTLLAVCLGFVVFRAPSLGAAFTYIGRMFTPGGGVSDALPFFSPYMLTLLCAAVIFSVPAVPYLRKRAVALVGETVADTAGYVICIPALAASVMTLASSSFNPFIYFIF